jgi:menaquinone-specific isochorismate synthase
VKQSFAPDKEEWGRAVERALNSGVKKVVLARRLTLELEESPDPFAITAALAQKSEGAFVFCLSSKETAFLGASPERLFKRRANKIESEAMAGTRARNASPDELLASEKEVREHAFVQNFLQERLSPLCLSPPVFSELGIHRTHNVQHLYAQGKATLKEGIADAQILDQIHPTPALLGAPSDQALRLIQELEPFERGLYGGAIGWSTPEESEWIVAIRSCLIVGKTVHLYTGAGIVSGSDPGQEWEELDHKLKLYDGIFL